MLNVYEQVDQNKRRSTLIIVLFFIFFLTIGYLLSVYFGSNNNFIVYALLISLFSTLVSYFKGDQIILALNRAKPTDRKTYFNYYTVVENLSLASQIPMPKIYFIDSPALNAFATGRDPDHALVCVTTGLLAKLNRSQLEAVIAHELSHIKNYDIRLMMIVSLLVGSLSLLIRFGFSSRTGSRKKGGSNPLAIIGVILLILSPLIAKLLKLAISRRREFLADASAVKLTRQPQNLISALKTISQDPNVLQSASTATASLYIANPFKNDKIGNLFSTHPPIKKRIEALNQML